MAAEAVTVLGSAASTPVRALIARIPARAKVVQHAGAAPSLTRTAESLHLGPLRDAAASLGVPFSVEPEAETTWLYSPKRDE